MIADDRLRQAYAAWLARQHADPSAPEPESIARLVAREGSDTERLVLLDQLLKDPRLGHELAVLQTTREASGIANASPSFPRLWAAAAALVVVVSVGVWRTARPADAPRRGGGDVVLTPEWADRALAWQPVPSAIDYRVEIVSANGDSVQSVLTRDTALVNVRVGALPVGARWRVTARRADGTAVSSPFRLLTTTRTTP